MLVSVTLSSPLAHLSLRDPGRIEADAGVLKAFWESEARMGFPLSDDAKTNQRRLMAISGVVATQGHKMTRHGEAMAKQRAAKAAAAPAQAPQAKAAPPHGKGKAA